MLCFLSFEGGVSTCIDDEQLHVGDNSLSLSMQEELDEEMAGMLDLGSKLQSDGTG